MLTARRTAAVAAYATALLSRPDAAVLALFGTGALAEPHVEALAAVRPLREVRVVGRTAARAAQTAARLRAAGWPARPERTPDALRGASLVVTATTSTTPLFADGDLEDGAHVNAMGACTPEACEIPRETMRRAAVVVERRETAWLEAGDLIAAGLERSSAVELHDRSAVSGLRAARPDGITLFESVGEAVADMAAVEVIRAGLARPR